MVAADHKKLDIAGEYLDAAMQMYLERKYFCAIHLAAAAAELFDLYLPQEKRLFTIAVNAERGLNALETGEKLDDRTVKKKLKSAEKLDQTYE